MDIDDSKIYFYPLLIFTLILLMVRLIIERVHDSPIGTVRTFHVHNYWLVQRRTISPVWVTFTFCGEAPDLRRQACLLFDVVEKYG